MVAKEKIKRGKKGVEKLEKNRRDDKYLKNYRKYLIMNTESQFIDMQTTERVLVPSPVGSSLMKALVSKYNSEITCAKATLSIYVNSPVGIGEHPQHLEEMDKLIDQIAANEDKLAAIDNHFTLT